MGFRAPYLGINKKMLKTLAEAGFHWDSSRCYLQKGLIPESGSVDLILDFYKPMKKWELASHNGLMEIPLSLPDDEILVDRLGYKGKRIGELWIDMCEKMVDAEQVPVLQLHPERARLCRDALDSIFEWARKSDIEFKFLSEIAKGRFEPGKTIVLSGDIDYMTISDFKHLRGQ